jgi:ribosomal protein L11 methyltransferase
MEWTQISVLTSVEAQDAVVNILMDFDSLGVELENLDDGVKINSYFPEDWDVITKVPAIQNRVNQLSSFGLNPGKGLVVTKSMNDDKWNAEWEKYYHVTRVTRFLTIAPVWENYHKQHDNELVITLDPKKAFGTGLHPTTVLCLQAIEDVIREGNTVLDIGTGSGVLSIAAKLLGAANVAAYDYDDDAVQSAKRNVALNGYEDVIRVGKNSLLDGINEKVDVIFANMLPEAVIPLISQSVKNLIDNGKIIISGIIIERCTEIKQVLLDNGFVVDQVRTLDGWCGIIAHKKRGDE